MQKNYRPLPRRGLSWKIAGSWSCWIEEALLKRAGHLILLGLFILTSCGYHLRGKETNLPPEIRSVAIPIFANRTLETGIETQVTEALVEKFISAKRLPVTTQSSADALLTVTTSTQVTTEYRATVVIEFTFKNQADGKILFREEMSDWRNYPVESDLNATEQNKKEAIRRISVLLADRVHELILGGF
jgi:outer membrane lipopolysaccharide assembly protein LptE/RlpB